MSPRVIPRQRQTPEVDEAERKAGEAHLELARAERRAQEARDEANRPPTTAESWRAIGIAPDDKASQEAFLETDSVYGAGSRHSYFRDLVADAIARKNQQALDFHPVSAGKPIPDDIGEAPIANAGTLSEVRKRLASVETRDVTSADPGYGAFLGPGFLGDRFNEAARAEGSLAAALGLEPLPMGVKEVLIPRFATGASAAVQATEGGAVSEEENVDGATQAGKIAVVAGSVVFSVQALEWADPQADVSIAQDLGSALGAAVDAQLVMGSNGSGQTLGLNSVTSIQSVSYVDASPTSGEFVANVWEAYAGIAATGPASPDDYMVVLHPRRLAWSFANPQGATPGQVVAPLFPGRVVATGGVPTNQGAGTEDIVFLIVPSELPAFAGPVSLIVDDESLSAGLQIRVTAFRKLATGFGRAPASISKLSGSGCIAPTFL
jgi:hypothetical protein